MRDHVALTRPHDQTPTAADGEAAIAAQRDPAAFDLLYLRFLDRVYRYVRSRTGSAEDAADLTQEIFARALDALPRYRVQDAPFAAWLFRIARNAVIDFSRRTRVTIAWDLLPEILHPATALDVETTVLRREALGRLRTLLLALSAEQRELLALRFAAGLSSSEIALVIGKSESATKKQLTRLLNTLKGRYHDAE